MQNRCRRMQTYAESVKIVQEKHCFWMPLASQATLLPILCSQSLCFRQQYVLDDKLQVWRRKAGVFSRLPIPPGPPESSPSALPIRMARRNKRSSGAQVYATRLARADFSGIAPLCAGGVARKGGEVSSTTNCKFGGERGVATKRFISACRNPLAQSATTKPP